MRIQGKTGGGVAAYLFCDKGFVGVLRRGGKRVRTVRLRVGEWGCIGLLRRLLELRIDGKARGPMVVVASSVNVQLHLLL